jgi:hypothetical protein
MFLLWCCGVKSNNSEPSLSGCMYIHTYLTSVEANIEHFHLGLIFGGVIINDSKLVICLTLSPINAVYPTFGSSQPLELIYDLFTVLVDPVLSRASSGMLGGA